MFVLLRPDRDYLVRFVQEEFVLLRLNQNIVLCMILRFEPYHQRQLFGCEFKHAHGDFERATCESARLGRNRHLPYFFELTGDELVCGFQIVADSVECGFKTVAGKN